MRSVWFIIGTLAAAFAIGAPANSPRTFSVVVHQSNSTSNLRFSDLQAFFSGHGKRWPNGSNVVLVERSPDSPAFRFLLDRVLSMSPGEYKRRLANIEFMGDAPVNLKILNSEEAACKYVFNVPGSIALIETESLQTSVCSGVHVVRIDGKLPAEEGYRLR
ncbi:MAG TPA: hypothetical protein VEU96_31170 [Bryobacteraceae bacterium]|nr:hypothetical protein [Bryobacteraceae bacterium]